LALYLTVFVIGLGVVQSAQALGVDSPDILAVMMVAVTAPLMLPRRTMDP